MKNKITEHKERILSFWGNFERSHILCAAICAIAAAIAALVGFIAYSAAYSDIFPHTRVEGCEIGGMSADEAKAVISDSFSDLTDTRRLTLVCGESSETLTLAQLGVTLDFDKTVKAAELRGRQGGVLSKAAVLFMSAFKSCDLELCSEVNEETLDAVVTRIAAGHETGVTNMSYRLEGKNLVITKGEGGICVDRAQVANELKAAVSNAEIKTVTLEPVPTEPEPIDADKLIAELSKEPRDAYYKKDENGKIVIESEVPKVIVDKEKLSLALSSDDTVCSIEVETVMPEKTAEDLRKMLFRDTLSSFSSGFASSSASRAANVTLSASRINGVVLMPGEVFSYDKTIGRRTSANGYREAGVYIGNKVESGIGGGICQTSSTLYSAALYANLEIVSRTSHSLPVSYVPAGQDATIAEGSIDLKLKNNTEYPIKIVAAVNGRTLTCKILGVKTPNQSVELVHTRTADYSPKTERTANDAIPKGYKKIVNRGSAGYSIASKRIVKIGGEIVKTESLTRSVYHAANIEEEVNPADINTPSENLKVYTGKVSESSEEPTGPTTSTPPSDGGNQTSSETSTETGSETSSEVQATEQTDISTIDITDVPSAQNNAE